MNTFTLIFLFTAGAGLLLQEWLLQRHRRYVADNRRQVPEPFEQRISLEQHQKAADYTLAKTGVARVELLYSTLVLVLFTLGGGIEYLNQRWLSLELGSLATGIGLVVSTFLLLGLLDLPFSLWRTFVLEEQFGFNRTRIGRFFADLLLQAVLLLVLGGPIALAVLWLMQEAGDLWWVAAWLLVVGFMLTVTWIYPTLVAPLFNRFTPLGDDELRERIEQLLSRCGFVSSGIFVMDGSRRSGHGNAYFTGFGKHKRIVFFDTLVDALVADEMEAVLAHELGHFKHGHILKQLLMSAFTTLIGFGVMGWLSNQPWFYHGLGVSAASNPLALLLFLVVAPVFTLFLQPFFSLLYRRYEFQADAFARSQTGAEPLINALVKLYRENASTLTPDPLYSAFHDSHPPANERIAQLVGSKTL